MSAALRAYSEAESRNQRSLGGSRFLRSVSNFGRDTLLA